MNNKAKRFAIAAAFLVWGLGGALLVWGAVKTFFPYKDVAAGVTAKGIQQVRVGMRPGQVTAILGRPYTMTSYKGSLSHKIGCSTWAETELAEDVTDNTNIERFFRQLQADTTVHSCDLTDERKFDRRTTFIYSRPGGFFARYPMLWVHFDQRGLVNEVYAKEYDLDDTCIYSLSSDQSQNVNNETVLVDLFG